MIAFLVDVNNQVKGAKSPESPANRLTDKQFQRVKLDYEALIKKAHLYHL